MTATSYALRRPCRRCPFRSDVVPYLRVERAEEIAAQIRGGGEFVCHKTTVAREDDDGVEEMVPGAHPLACAGVLATLERAGETNQMTRIAERIGLYDPAALSPDAPVYPSLTAWVAAHREPTDLVHCEVGGPDCQDPAGYSGSGGVYENAAEGTCNEDNSCRYCGNVMCGDCSSEIEYVCVFCVEELDDDPDTRINRVD